VIKEKNNKQKNKLSSKFSIFSIWEIYFRNHSCIALVKYVIPHLLKIKEKE